MSALPPDIESWDRTELVRRWRSAFGQDPPSHVRTDFMRRAVAWQIQNGLPDGKPGKLPEQLRCRVPVGLAPGTRLVREWRGNTYQVLVTDKGYEYAGATFSSLTAIAKRITGSAWSGPSFFGTNR